MINGVSIYEKVSKMVVPKAYGERKAGERRIQPCNVGQNYGLDSNAAQGEKDARH